MTRHNFCPCCGKYVGGSEGIHTCSPQTRVLAHQRIAELEKELETERCLSFRNQVAGLEAENLKLREALKHWLDSSLEEPSLSFCIRHSEQVVSTPPGDMAALREVIARVLEECGWAQRIGGRDYGTDPYYLLIGNAEQLRSGEWTPEALK